MHWIFVPRRVRTRNLETGEPHNSFFHEAGPDRVAWKDNNGNHVFIGPDNPWSLWRWVAAYVARNPKLGKGDTGAKRVKRLRRALRHAKPLTWVQVDSEIVEAIKKILEDPSGTGAPEWDLAVASQLIDFSDAFKEAVEVKGGAEPPTAPPPWYDPDPDAVLGDDEESRISHDVDAIEKSNNGEPAHA